MCSSDLVVVRGRKVPKGAVGTVFWMGDCYNQFSYRTEKRVGIDVDGERVFLPADYVVRENWEMHLLTGRERKQKIRNYALNSLPSYYRERFMKFAS